MTWLGAIHVLLMVAALTIGAGLLLARKSTPRHRASGRGFVMAVLVSNIHVFAIHEDSARIGVFHGLAVVSFASVLAGVVLARTRRGGPGARIGHGHVMHWSFGGMVAAGRGQGATFLGAVSLAILATFLVVGLLAARRDFKSMRTGGLCSGPGFCGEPARN